MISEYARDYPTDNSFIVEPDADLPEGPPYDPEIDNYYVDPRHSYTSVGVSTYNLNHPDWRFGPFTDPPAGTNIFSSVPDMWYDRMSRFADSIHAECDRIEAARPGDDKQSLITMRRNTADFRERFVGSIESIDREREEILRERDDLNIERARLAAREEKLIADIDRGRCVHTIDQDIKMLDEQRADLLRQRASLIAHVEPGSPRKRQKVHITQELEPCQSDRRRNATPSIDPGALSARPKMLYSIIKAEPDDDMLSETKTSGDSSSHENSFNAATYLDLNENPDLSTLSPTERSAVRDFHGLAPSQYPPRSGLQTNRTRLSDLTAGARCETPSRDDSPPYLDVTSRVNNVVFGDNPGPRACRSPPNHVPTPLGKVSAMSPGKGARAPSAATAFFQGGAAAAGAVVTALLLLSLAAAAQQLTPTLHSFLAGNSGIVTTLKLGETALAQIASATTRAANAAETLARAQVSWGTATTIYLVMPPLSKFLQGMAWRLARLLPHLPAATTIIRGAVIDGALVICGELLRNAARFSIMVIILSYLATPTRQMLLCATPRARVPPDLRTVADSGAGIHAIRDAALAVPGSLRPNTTAIFTAGGRTVPELMCDAIIDTIATDGSPVRLKLDDALLMTECEHNLVSLSLLSRDYGVSSHLGTSDGSFLQLPDSRKVKLVHDGVYFIPDAASAIILSATVEGETEEANASVSESMWKLIHNRFNGRSHDVLRNLVSSGHAVPRDWHRALKHAPRDPCHTCLRAHATKLPSRAHVPSASAPGQISYDIMEMGIPHMTGGHRYVIGFHDAYSHLNKVYLLSSKSQAPQAIERFHAWARSLGVDIRHFHADNAPELTGKTVKDHWQARGIRVTACAPYVPRGNGMMERQWRTINNDTRHLLATANLPPKAWWYALRAAVDVSHAIPINSTETPWSRFTGRRSSPLIHKVFGCLAYYLDRSPASKAHMRAKRGLNFGRAEDQPGYSIYDLDTKSVIVTPHVRFVEDNFPGMVRADMPSGGGAHLPVDIEDIGRLFNSDGSASNSALPDPVANPASDPAELISELTDDPPTDETSRISQRLSRINRGRGGAPPNVHSFVATPVQGNGFSTPHIPVPAGKEYFVYLGSGPERNGSIKAHLESLGSLTVVPIDSRIGGYDHDLTDSAVQRRIFEIVSDAKCKGVFVSIPCKTFSVLRSKPGVEHSYPLRNVRNVLGIPREDGTLPLKVVHSNIMSDFAAQMMQIVHDNGGVFVAESPPGRGANSRFPIAGREEHVSQFDHPAWVDLREATSARMIYFDQCALHDGEPSEVARKKTAFLVNPKGYPAFHARFAPLICTHGYQSHKDAYGIDASTSRFQSPDTENYPSKMNALIAEALIQAVLSTGPDISEAGVTPLPDSASPLSSWGAYYTCSSVPNADSLTWPIQRDVADQPPSSQLLEAASPLIGSDFSNSLYHTGIDNQLFAAPREISSNNPTYRQARASPEWEHWQKACDDEISNLRRLGTIDENDAIPEDTLPSWNPAKGSAREVVNILWVLRVKYVDGVFDKFKARAVVDGRDQKKKNPLMETFSPACRSTTHKLIVAEGCLLGYQKRTWDVEAAYLKGKLPEGQPIYARPPLGYRSFINGVPLVWRLNTPLYGEADAGRLWYKTIITFLLEQRVFACSPSTTHACSGSNSRTDHACTSSCTSTTDSQSITARKRPTTSLTP